MLAAFPLALFVVLLYCWKPISYNFTLVVFSLAKLSLMMIVWAKIQ
jgi:hypothetical protein